MPVDVNAAKAIFMTALEKIDRGERAAYVREACGHDDALRQRVEILLKAHEDPGSFMKSPIAGLAAAVVATVDEPISERPGSVIGPYKLMEQIGEGGMGLVFVAEQQQPVRRKVALKVIKPGMDTRQVVARFEAERQALALMDHPNIAKVLDGGETASGRPYFVMELVKGMPITDYCDQNQVPIRQRLELFVSVCQAVQHAHQKGIIHRDLKPSNVMVMSHDGTPVPKIIDFGVAKSIGQQLTDKTIYTQFTQLIGTPLYMSPEQAGQSGLDVDTRSDIYSLGVLLYELLTGTTPFDKERLREVDYDEIRRIIRVEEPPKPSTRISTLGQAATTVSTQRQSDPQRLTQLFRRELDWIVMKALEKDRDRRYETANSFAADVQRYLRDEPVRACPPSAIYRLRKFARRNKAAFLTTLAVAASLVLAVVVLAVSTVRIKLERDEATRRLYRSLVNEARASRRSNRIGQRFDSLARLEEAAAMARDLGLGADDFLELRNEVIACLALPDLHKVREWTGYPEGTAHIASDQALERYARCDRQGKISVRRIADDSELVSFATDIGQVWLAFSPDGQYLAGFTEAAASQVRVWKLGPATAPPIISLSGAKPEWPSFSGDSRYFAVACDARSVQVYDLGAGKPVTRLTLADTPTAVAYHPFKRQIAVGLPTRIQVLDQDSSKVVTELRGSRGNRYLAWHPGGKRLAAVGSDHIVRQWDVATGQQLARIEGFTNGGIELAFNRAGTLAASQGWENKLRLWNARTGEQLFQTVSDWPLMPRFSADDRRLLLLRGERVQLWEIASDRAFRTLTLDPSKDRLFTAISGCSICPKNARLVAASLHDGIALWDLATGEPLDFLAVGGPSPVLFDGTGALWTDILGGTVQRFPMQAGTGSPAALRLGPPQAITPLGEDGMGLACSPDGRVVATGQRDGALVWHRDDPDKVVRLGPQPDVRNVDVSGDGRLVATGSHNGTTAKLWDARTGECLKTFEGAHWTVAFSPDQKWLFVGGRNQLWKVDSWQAGPVLGTHVSAVAFSPDSRYLARETGQGVVQLVHVATGREFARLEDPKQGRAHWITFTPDGTKLLTTSPEYNSIHVWDLRALRQELDTFGLDWDQPAFEPAKQQPDAAPLKLTVDLGDLAVPGRAPNKSKPDSTKEGAGAAADSRRD